MLVEWKARDKPGSDAACSADELTKQLDISPMDIVAPQNPLFEFDSLPFFQRFVSIHEFLDRSQLFNLKERIRGSKGIIAFWIEIIPIWDCCFPMSMQSLLEIKDTDIAVYVLIWFADAGIRRVWPNVLPQCYIDDFVHAEPLACLEIDLSC